MRQTLWLLVMFLVAPVLPQTLTLSDQTCDAERRRVDVQTSGANILIGGLFDIREHGTDGFGCGVPNAELMQVYEAARWTIQELNRNTYVPGVTFGMQAFDTCTLEGSGLAAVNEFYPQSASNSSYCSTSSNVYKLGLLGPMQSSVSILLGEILGSIPASVISMRSSAPSLSNKFLYPTFLRTDQSASAYARAITEMFKSLQWEKIVIVYVDDASGIGGYQAIHQAASATGICVSGVISLGLDGNTTEYQNKLESLAVYNVTAAVFYGYSTHAVMTLKVLEQIQTVGVRNIKWMFNHLDLDADLTAYQSARSAVVVLPTTTTISGFKTYFRGLTVTSPPSENPWLQDWYMNKNQCKLPNVNYAPFSSLANCPASPTIGDFNQSPYVEQTIIALYAYAEAIKRVCGSQSGVCGNLRNMDPLTFHRDHLSKVDYTFPNTFSIAELRGHRLAFDVNGDPLTSAFTFYIYNDRSGAFNFEKFAEYTDGVLTMTTTPGNLFSASPCPPDGCTNCLQPVSDLTLAYKPGDIVILALVDAHEPDQQGMTCGTAIPDRLIDAVAVRYGVETVTVLQSRGISVGYLIVDVCPGLQTAESFLTNLLGGRKLYTDASGIMITTNNIVAVLDMTREDTGWSIAPTLTSLGISQIRIASTSSMLLRNSMYPYVISAVPSQETVQLAIVQMLTSLHWKYIQIVSEARGSYYKAAENFHRLASRMGICIAMWSTFDMGPAAVVNRLRETQDAPLVVVFGSREHLRSLLQATPTDRQLTFIFGSEEFGTSDTVISGFSNANAGTLTVQLVERSNNDLTSWLTGRPLNGSDPFLVQWFEYKNNCSLTSSSRGNYDSVCSTTVFPSSLEVYQGYAPYIIRAVASIASAVNSILTTQCTSGNRICSQFRNQNNLAEQIINILRDSSSNTQFEIMNGEGMSDLFYFNYRNGNYMQVGIFDTNTRRISQLTPSSIFLANGSIASSVNTQCMGHCTQCQYAYSYQEIGYVPGDWLIGGIFAISEPGPDGRRPYVCGDAQTAYGFQYTAAMLFALDRINRGLGPIKLNNVTLGGLFMDHCNNENRAFGLISDVYSGLTELTWQDKMGDGSHFTSTDILAWLTDSGASTVEAAEILQPLGVAIVSPSATSASLLNNPTFFRTIQGDATIALAIVRLCKSLGITYIQVVYAADSYGHDSLSTFTNTAMQESLCITSTTEVPYTANYSQIVRSVSESNTRVVLLFLGASMTSAFLQEATRLTSNQLTFIMPVPYAGVVTQTPNSNQLRNLLSLQPNNSVTTDYTNFLNNISQNSKNPFFAKYYMKLFNCNLPGYYMYPTDCSNQVLTSAYDPSSFALSTINAVYAVATALHTTLVDLCGEGYSSECSALIDSASVYSKFLANLKIIQFPDLINRPFQFLNREGNVIYNVLRFSGTQYETIGRFGGASLILDNPDQLRADYNGVGPGCTSRCPACDSYPIQFSYTPGDIYLAGVFDVHGKGQSVFDCGDINTENGFQLLAGFHYALQRVNSKQDQFANILRGVTLGGIGLDACQSAIRGGNLVSNINNKRTLLWRDGKMISPENIDLYVASYSSDSSIYLSRILTDIKVPQISYASTSTTLKDKRVYPYFFRTVPADDRQVLGMLNYLNQNNLRYVQLMYADSSYGQHGVNQFDLLIRNYNFSICVAQRVVFPVSGLVSDENADDVVAKLLQKPVANTVIIFADTNYIRALLEAVQRSAQASRTFKFIGPETWGDRSDVTVNTGGIAQDAVTFIVDTVYDPDGFFHDYLEKSTPSNSGNNPWFDEWFQNILNCYTTPSNSHRYSVPCGTVESLVSRIKNEDTGVLHVMNAVYSAAFALDATLTEFCGVNYTAVCGAYRGNEDRRTKLVQNLEYVNFTDPSGTQFRFVDREGNKGYKLLKWTNTPGNVNMVYDIIGNFTSSNVLQFNKTRLTPTYDGSCERNDACVECPTIRNRGVRFAVGGDPNGKITLIGVFNVHNQGTILQQCGPINMEGFQRFLNFFWTYDQYAKSASIRLLVLDSCSSSLRVGQDLYGLLKDGTLCNSEYFNLTNLGLENIAGVVVTGEENTLAAAHVLEPLMVTYVSPDSVSPLMDDYLYLLRSITPWSGFVHILSRFAADSGWTFINAIYVRSGRGQSEYDVFQEITSEAGICLNGGLALPEDASDSDIRTALAKLDSSSGARVVVLLSSPSVSLKILQLAQESGIADDYLWIFGIENMQFLSNIPAGVSFKAILMQPQVQNWNTFNQYVESLSYDPNLIEFNNASIPRVWWEDFYQTIHNCQLQNAVYPLEFNVKCKTDEKISGFMHNKMVHYNFLASVFSMTGLQEFLNARCNGQTIQECLNYLKQRQLVRDYILNKTISLNNTEYYFNRTYRYIEPHYDLYLISVENGVLRGTELYQSYGNGKFNTHSKVIDITSNCQRFDGCGCQTDDPYTEAQTGDNKFNPTSPRNYYKYSRGEKLYEWPVWAIVVAVLTCVGLLITIISFLVLLIFYPVKSGTSILGFLTMIGIMGIYVINFAFFLHASEATCGARRFVMGVVYTIVFASLLVKAVDNWRFADMEYSNHQYRGITNSCTLFLIALGIVLIQCIIPIEWLILVHPTARKWSNLDVHDYWWCDPPDFYDIGLVLSFIFVMFILLLTAIFATLAWDSDSNNRESRWILVSAIATAGCFLVWMIVTTNAGPEYRDPAVAIANFVNATLLLIFIPLRKMHLMCLAKKEKPTEFDNLDIYSSVYNNQTFEHDADDAVFEPTEKDDDRFVTE